MITVNKLERRYMQRDVNEICHQSSLEMRYYDDNNFESGYSDTQSTGWSNWGEYDCEPHRIDELNVKRYAFGNVEEGDLVLNIPKDTELPLDKDKYDIKFQNETYHCTTGLQNSELVNDEPLHYVMIGKL